VTRTISVIALILWWPLQIWGQDSQPRSLKQAQFAVAKLSCTRRGSTSDHHASAFVWKNRRTLVTALHSVADCTNILVEFQTPGGIASQYATIHRGRNSLASFRCLWLDGWWSVRD
jgi:hypothetical protein